jgi:hypothetical protein
MSVITFAHFELMKVVQAWHDVLLQLGPLGPELVPLWQHIGPLTDHFQYLMGIDMAPPLLPILLWSYTSLRSIVLISKYLREENNI